VGGGPLRREAVLIVDDDESTRAAIAAILGDAGYVTREADCGEEACARCASSLPLSCCSM